MSKPEFDRNDQGNGSMFDFLSEDTDGQNARRSTQRRSKRKIMPVIRKPVPISKSGPLLPPKPGDPVEPPPPLTTGPATKVESAGSEKKAKISDDLDFLDDTRAESPDLRPVIKKKSRVESQDNVRPLHKAEGMDDQQELEQEFEHLKSSKKTGGDFEFDNNWRDGHTAYEDYPEQRSSGWLKTTALLVSLPLIAGGGFYAYSEGHLDGLIAATGLGTEQVGTGVAVESGSVDGSEFLGNSSVDTSTLAVGSVAAGVPVESSLFVRFQDQLTKIESLVSDGLLDDAEQALASMDRSVYGYGAAEFSALEEQIILIRSGQGNAAELAEAERLEQLSLANELALEAERLAAEQARIAEAAAAAEAQRLAELQRAELAAAEAEAKRLADARTAAAEANRLADARQAELAAAEAKRLADARQAELAAAEAQRLADARQSELAAAEVQRLAEARVSAERAAEAERVARLREAEQRAAQLEQTQTLQEREREAAQLLERQRLEQIAARQPQVSAQESESLLSEQRTRDAALEADKIRLDALEEAAREEARRQITAADRLATDRRIAEERAALERQASREARIQRAREIEAENAAARANATVTPQQNTTERLALVQNPPINNRVNTTPELNAPAAQSPVPRSITDSELQTVYQRFTELQNAISERDITKVVNLTERSGLRVQQLMQVFENSVGIDVRIRNVSTSNATGEVNGTLQIRSIERSDGTLAEPPANLESIKLTTEREGADWSIIRW